jgi:iron complex outermembrane receptor protein
MRPEHFWTKVRAQHAGRRSSIYFLSAAILALAFLFVYQDSRAWAADETQADLKHLSLAELGNVQVTAASKEPEQVWKTSAAIYVITQEDIHRAGVTTIPEALRLAPGVEAARINNNEWAIGIRGFGSNLTRDVLVLIDGRTVYSTLLAGTYWNVQNLVMEDVDRIEVIRGPGGIIWGPNAVNGVINIITKSSKDTQGELVSVIGSPGTGIVDTRYGGSDGKGLTYRVYAMAFDRGPGYHLTGPDYDSWRAVQGGARVDIARDNRNSFTVQGDVYDEGAGESVTATYYAPPYQQVLDGTSKLSGGNILARWHQVQGEGKDFAIQAYYDRTNRHELNFADLRDTVDVDFLDRFRLPGAQQISWGAGARFSRGTNPTIVSGLYFTPPTRTDELFTGFLQDEIGLIQNRLTLSLGTKLLKTNYTGLQLQPGARLLWTPTKTQTLWAAFTHALRTPSDAERAFNLTGYIGTLNGLPFFARFSPNPNFRSEELNGYEIGYRRLFTEKVYVDVSAFYNHYGDLFSEDLIGGPFLENNPAPPHYLLPAEFGNGLVGTTRGVEIAPEWRPLSFWRLQASYSFLQMQLRKGTNSQDVGTAPITEGSSPRHEGTATSGVDFKKVFSFDLTFRYVSGLHAQDIRSYSTADTRFDWRPKPFLTFSVVGRNLFQPYHFEYGSGPGPNVAVKRGVYGQINWQR